MNIILLLECTLLVGLKHWSHLGLNCHLVGPRCQCQPHNQSEIVNIINKNNILVVHVFVLHTVHYKH